MGSLEGEVERVGNRRSRRPPRLNGDELRDKLACESRDDLVLQKKSATGLSNRSAQRCAPVSVSMSCTLIRRRFSARWDASFERISRVEVAADLLQIHVFALIGEGSVATDDKRAVDARQISDQALGHAIDDILLFRVTSFDDGLIANEVEDLREGG
jgi:hypothetical protein